MLRSSIFAFAFAATVSPAFAQMPAAQALVARGDYLVNSIMSCGNCHTPQGPNGPQMDKALSGGLRFDEPPFNVTAPNITPDRETGIGGWSDAELRRMLRTGIRPNGVPVAPVMPTGFYGIITPGDLDAIVAYLRSIKPISNKVAEPIYKIPLPPWVFPGAEKPIGEADLKDKVKRGFYLATIGHCMECHTPLGRTGLQVATAMGMGGREFPGPWGVSKSANITPAGLGKWTDAEIKRAISQGISRDGHVLKPPMGYAFYARMTDADLDAVIAWLRTVRSVE